MPCIRLVLAIPLGTCKETIPVKQAESQSTQTPKLAECRNNPKPYYQYKCTSNPLNNGHSSTP